MQKAEKRQVRNPYSPRESGGLSMDSPNAERVARFQSMIDSSPVMASQRRMLERITQREEDEPLQKKPNETGLPDNLKSGISVYAQPVQRLVAWVTPKNGKPDRTALHTNLVAHTDVGGKIKKFDDTDFANDFGMDNEPLAITGHGKTGYVEGKSANDIASALTDEIKGLKSGYHDIIFYSCNSEKTWVSGEIKLDSVVNTVKNAINDRGKEAKWSNIPKVTGSAGPRIVIRNKTLEDYQIITAVVDPVHESTVTSIQHVLSNVITDVGEKIDPNFDKEGGEIIKAAEDDEAEVGKLKHALIQIVSGTPKNIDEELRYKIIKKWNEIYDKEEGKLLFEKGVNLSLGGGLTKEEYEAKKKEEYEAKKNGGCNIL